MSLRAVLNTFERGEALTITEMSHKLEMSPAMLEQMIGHLVRQGRLREISFGSGCTSCGVKGDCPFVARMPRSYELATTADEPAITPPCSCGHCG